MMVKPEIEEHYVCGNCKSCFFSDKDAAEECCTPKSGSWYYQQYLFSDKKQKGE